jgi:hypothetical protein
MDRLENGRALGIYHINEFKPFVLLKSIGYWLSHQCGNIRSGILRRGNERGIYLWALQEPRAMGIPAFSRTFKTYIA